MAPRMRKPAARKPKRSGRGLGNVDENLARNEARRRKGKAQFLKIGDGNSVVVRVVTVGEEFKDGQIHPVEFKGRKSDFTRDVMCLDQEDEGIPCPGCRDDLERRYKFWAVVIQRDAEKLNSSGKVIGHEDQVKVMSGASRLVKELNKKHKKRPLDQCDIMITQSGTGFDVEYEVEWCPEGAEALTAGDDEEPLASDEFEKQPLTDDEQALIEEGKAAFDKVAEQTTIPDFDDFYELPGRDNDDDDEDVGEKSRRRGSGFAQRGKKKSSSRRSQEEDEDDEDDDDDEEPAPRRRRATSRSKTAKTSKPTGLAAMAAKRKGTGGGSKSGANIKRRPKR